MSAGSGEDEDFASWTAHQWESTVPELDASVSELAIRFGRVASRYDRVKDRALRGFHGAGVSGFEDFRTLSLLRKVESPGVTVSDIADQLEITRGATSTRLDRFDREGLVERHPHPKDRRSHTVTLADGVADLVDDMYRALHSAHQEYFRSLDGKELKTLSGILGKVLDDHQPSQWAR